MSPCSGLGDPMKVLGVCLCLSDEKHPTICKKCDCRNMFVDGGATFARASFWRKMFREANCETFTPFPHPEWTVSRFLSCMQDIVLGVDHNLAHILGMA